MTGKLCPGLSSGHVTAYSDVAICSMSNRDLTKNYRSPSSLKLLWMTTSKKMLAG